MHRSLAKACPGSQGIALLSILETPSSRLPEPAPWPASSLPHIGPGPCACATPPAASRMRGRLLRCLERAPVAGEPGGAGGGNRSPSRFRHGAGSRLCHFGHRAGSNLFKFDHRRQSPFAEVGLGITGELWDEPRYHQPNDRRPVATCRDDPRQRFHALDRRGS
jgi:hypothetical protein